MNSLQMKISNMGLNPYFTELQINFTFSHRILEPNQVLCCYSVAQRSGENQPTNQEVSSHQITPGPPSGITGLCSKDAESTHRH